MSSRHRRALQSFAFWLHHNFDRQVEFFGKLKVARVVGGNCHNRPGAIIHQHVISDPDGHLFAIYRIDRIAACPHARFFLSFRHAIEVAFFSGGSLISGDRLRLFRCGQLFHQ